MHNTRVRTRAGSGGGGGSSRARSALAGMVAGVCLLGVLAAGGVSGCAPRVDRPAELSLEPLEVRKERAVDLAERAARLEADDPDRALALYRESIEAYSEFPAVWHNLGVFLLERREMLPAQEALQTAADLEPTDPRPVYLLGKAWFDLRYFPEAGGQFERAVARDRNYLPAIRGIVAVSRAERSADERTLAMIERGLLLERDPEWISFFQAERLRIESALDRSPI